MWDFTCILMMSSHRVDPQTLLCTCICVCGFPLVFFFFYIKYMTKHYRGSPLHCGAEAEAARRLQRFIRQLEHRQTVQQTGPGPAVLQEKNVD